MQKVYLSKTMNWFGLPSLIILIISSLEWQGAVNCSRSGVLCLAGTPNMQSIWLLITPSSRLVVWFSLYRWRIPLVTSTNGLPDEKLTVWVSPPPEEAESAPATDTEAGVESFVDRLQDEALKGTGQ